MTQPAVATESTQPPTPGFQDLWRNKNYRRLLAAQFVSDLGDGVYALGLLWAMKVLTGSGVQVSMVLTAEVIPTLLIGIFAGVFVDRGNKKSYMVNTDLIRGAIVAILAGLWWGELIQPWMLIAAAAMLSTCSAFFNPARTVSMRTVVPTEAIQKASSVGSTVQTVVGLIAPAFGALLVSFDISWAFACNAASFFLSFLFLSRLHHEGLKGNAQGPIDFQALKASLKEGFRTILTVPILRNLIFYCVCLNFLFAPVSVLFPLYVDTAPMLATLETVTFVGILIGSICAGFVGKLPKIVPIAGGLFLVMIGFGGLYFFESLWAQMLSTFLFGFGIPITNITLNSMFVVKVPREVLGRASSTMGVFVQAAKPISLSLTATVLAILSVREMFLAVAVIGAVLVVLMVLNPVIRKTE